MARDNKGFACHAHHNMVSYEWHHVWPTQYHGPNTAANKIKICPNAHSDIHHLMDRILAGKSYSPRQYGKQIRFYAYYGASQVLDYIEQDLLSDR